MIKAIIREATYPVVRAYDTSGNWERQMSIDEFRNIVYKLTNNN